MNSCDVEALAVVGSGEIHDAALCSAVALVVGKFEVDCLFGENIEGTTAGGGVVEEGEV